MTLEPTNSLPRQNRRLIDATVLSLYALFVIVLWAYYGIRNGMPYETQLVYASQEGGVLNGFFNDSDPLRAYVRVFYHLAYLLSKWIGREGSFVTYQIVYAGLWFGRGALAFLIWKRLLPGFPLLAYMIGALVLFHASDTSLNWVGLLNHVGFIFWMYLSCYLLVSAFQQNGPVRAICYGVGAAGASYMSLWTYESALAEIVGFAVLVLLFFERRTMRNVLIAVGYCTVPLYYAYLAASRYLSPAGAGKYQLNVVRTAWPVSSIVRDALLDIYSSLSFWNWGATVQSNGWGWGQGPSSGVPTHVLVVFSACAFALVVIGGVAVAQLSGRTNEIVPSDRRVLLKLLFSGAVLLVLSRPAYLLLDRNFWTARAIFLWRTQFLSGFGAALIFASVAALGARVLSRRGLQLGVLLLTSGMIAACGIVSSLKTGHFNHNVWAGHRAAVSQILEIAPRVKDDTVIVLLNLPKGGADPFISHNMWFDVALTLAYPHTRVAGIYFYNDGTPSAGQNMVVRSGSWQQTPVGWPTSVRKADFSNTIVVKANASAQLRLAQTVPDQLGVDAETAKRYDPGAAILPGPPSPLALRRYAPIGELHP